MDVSNSFQNDPWSPKCAKSVNSYGEQCLNLVCLSKNPICFQTFLCISTTFEKFDVIINWKFGFFFAKAALDNHDAANMFRLGMNLFHANGIIVIALWKNKLIEMNDFVLFVECKSPLGWLKFCITLLIKCLSQLIDFDVIFFTVSVAGTHCSLLVRNEGDIIIFYVIDKNNNKMK